MSTVASIPHTARSGEIERYTFRERVIEWLVTVQQAVVRGAVQEIQGDLGVGIGG